MRRKYLGELFKLTDRNVIVYYSGWLQKAALERIGYSGFAVDDNDKNGFMAAIHKLDRSKGLDLFLHTPGGDLAATESLVDYLRAMFGKNIRAVIPQLAMSARTMMALSCKEIVMGKHSSLGPIDPQIFGIPAHGIIEEFNEAAKQIQTNPALIHLWHPIIAKYNPTLIGECQKAIAWSNEIVKEWLMLGMFDGDSDAEEKINVIALEDDNDFQEAALTVHHACIQTLSATPACKIIENHLGIAYIETVTP
jgi:ATP-dependent protease ClpP protease subunit